MNIRRFMRFVLSYALVGLIVAVAIAWLAPELLEHDRPAVTRSEPAAVAEAGPPLPAAPDIANGQRLSYANAVEATSPAVVNIYTSSRSADPRNALLEDPLFDQLFQEPPVAPPGELETSLGSGVLASPQGHILTSNHVIEGAQRIQVLLADGRTTPAEIVGTDPESDLAVLQINLPDLPHLALADSDRIRVGDVVLAIGNPFGVGQTVTQGIISALGRSELGLATFENFIQTDAAINPGNSGGALVSARGELIGINTAVFSQRGGATGIGFAVPADLARAVLTDIIEHGRVVRGWIGVRIQPASGVRGGAEIVDVLPGGPADRAGLAAGDVITHLEGRPIGGVRHLLNRISEREPGETVSLAGRRQSTTQRWQLAIAERPADLGQGRPQSPPSR